MDEPLSTRDVAALLGVKPETVRFYRAHSKPGGRYEAHRFPEPDFVVGVVPVWKAERRQDILDWDRTRVGQGVGGGRPAHRTTGEE